MDEVLLKTRQILFEEGQQAAAAKSKNPKGYISREFTSTWFPLEWEVFMLYGAPSEKPERAFFYE